ncbi:MAG: hypothetical protein A2X49_04485 [Lentisphaerae bacterium GWF2_52_8]|nr:MAG: hypothetical protein A2X49_04485 [Lentisphaerae bacterium GWF2_52_8]
MTIDKDYRPNYIEQQLRLILSAILDAERSFNLYKEIGSKTASLEKFGLKNYFGLSQRAFLSHMIISVVSIFEEPSKKYPTATLKEVIKRLQDKKQKLPKMDITRLAEAREITSPTEGREISIWDELSVNDDNERAATDKLATFLQTLTPQNDEYWESLKFMRDKIFAHKEIIEDFKCKVTDEYIDSLLKKARLAVKIIGKAYFAGFHVPINDSRDHQEFAKLLNYLNKAQES